MDNGYCQSGSASNSKSNGYEKIPESFPGNWTPQGSDSKAFFKKFSVPYNACYVKVTRVVPFFFVFGTGDSNGREVAAEAVAKQTRARVARIGAKSKALELNSANSPVLDGIIGGLLGEPLTLDVLSWQGLINANVKLKLLGVGLGLDVADPNKLLNTDIEIGKLLSVMATAVSEDKTLGVAVGALNKIISLSAKVKSIKIKLGDLINLSTPANAAALDTQVNVFEIVKASLQLANKNHALELDIPVNLVIAKLWVNLKILEAPKFAIGDPENNDLRATSEQVQLTIFLSDLLKLTVLEVGLGAATGEATFARGNYSCGVDKNLKVSGRSSLASIKKLKITSALLGDLINTEKIPKWLPSVIPLAEGKIDNFSFDLSRNPPIKIVQDPLAKEDWKKFGGNSSIATGLLNAVYSVIYALVPDLPELVKDTVIFILKTLLFPIELLLNEVLEILLNLLGIMVSVGEISGQLTCGYSSELVY